MSYAVSCIFCREQNKAITLSENGSFVYDKSLIDENMLFHVPAGLQQKLTFVITDMSSLSFMFHAEEKAQLEVRFIILFPEKLNMTIDAIACGQDSNITITGVYATHDDNQVTIKTNQQHVEKRTKTTLQLNGLLSGRSVAKYDGMIRIEQSASGSYASLQNKNILMSEGVAVVSIPNIEVLQHDVQCFHGTAVGRFDDLQFWYMQSRGLQSDQIKRLLVRGLFEKQLHGYEKKENVLKYICEKI